MNRLDILLFLTAVFFSCDKSQQNLSSAGNVDSVHVFTLHKEIVTKNLSLPAELVPRERAELYARLEGYVKEIKVDIGDAVKRNDVLIVLEAPEIISDYARAMAGKQAAQMHYQTSLDNYQRIEKASAEKGTVSEAERVSARYRMLGDSAAYVAARAASDAFLELKNYLLIRAPFNGIITQRNADPGTLAGKENIPLLVVENIDQLRLRVAIPEMYTSSIPATATIFFSVDARPSEQFPATLVRKSNFIDRKTRTELWEFQVANPDKILKSGMYGRVNLLLQRKEPSFTVPYSALVTNLEKNFIIRVNQGKAEWIDVRNGIPMSDRQEIFAELGNGDQIVLRANDEIPDGSSVIPANQE